MWVFRGSTDRVRNVGAVDGRAGRETCCVRVDVVVNVREAGAAFSREGTREAAVAGRWSICVVGLGRDAGRPAVSRVGADDTTLLEDAGLFGNGASSSSEVRVSLGYFRELRPLLWQYGVPGALVRTSSLIASACGASVFQPPDISTGHLEDSIKADPRTR